MAPKKEEPKALEKFRARIDAMIRDKGPELVLGVLGPLYRRLNSESTLIEGKMKYLKGLVVAAMQALGVDEYEATARTFLMLVWPIRLPTSASKKELLPALRKRLARHYGVEAVRGKIRIQRKVVYEVVVDRELKELIEKDSDVGFKRRLAKFLGAKTPDLRPSETPERVRKGRQRKGRAGKKPE